MVSLFLAINSKPGIEAESWPCYTWQASGHTPRGFSMRRLTDDIVLSVKDAARNLRYAIHSEPSYRPIGASASAARLPG
jgi:hypothetical protein